MMRPTTYPLMLPLFFLSESLERLPREDPWRTRCDGFREGITSGALMWPPPHLVRAVVILSRVFSNSPLCVRVCSSYSV